MAGVPWTREELIMSLDLYLRRPGPAARPDDHEVLRLSNAFRRMGEEMYGRIPPRYRSPSSIAMRASNWRAMNDDVVTSGRKGLENTGGLGREVWEDFHRRPDSLAATAAGILSDVEAGRFLLLVDRLKDFVDNTLALSDGITEASEGKVRTIQHLSFERNNKLAALKKAEAVAQLGSLRCEGCGMSFSERYGLHGDGFIEIHHTLPLSEYGGARRTSLDDLALLCANCHRMIHRHRKWLTIADLKAVLQ